MTSPAILIGIAEATGDHLLALDAQGWEWLVEAVTTAETLEDFATASRSYRERRGTWLKSDTGEPVRGTLAGCQRSRGPRYKSSRARNAAPYRSLTWAMCAWPWRRILATGWR